MKSHFLICSLISTLILGSLLFTSYNSNSAPDNTPHNREKTILAFSGKADVIYAAPDGKEAGNGSIRNPYTIHKAVKEVKAGGTVYLRGGTYRLTERVDLDKVGTAEKPYKLFAYRNEKPVLDCMETKAGEGSGHGILITTGCYWHIRGIEVKNAVNAAIRILDGSYNTFENCVSHHNGDSGFSIGYIHAGPTDHPHPNPDGTKAAFNTFINCDSHNNFDWLSVSSSGVPTPGTHADGFGIKGKEGRGNKFIGCRAWSNSDDAWDLWECGHAVQLIDCWAFSTGIWTDHVEMYRDRTGKELTEALFDGNGNGFKMGGGCRHNPDRTCQGVSEGTHLLRNCIAFNNATRGFDQNNHEYGAWIENCLAFNNGTNFGFWKANKDHTSWQFRNNISFGGKKKDRFETSIVTISLDENNSWNLNLGDPSAFASQFVSLSEEDARAPRSADGSLPSRFGRLKAGGVFIDKGAPTSNINGDGFRYPAIPYSGSAPDLGAYEYRP